MKHQSQKYIVEWWSIREEINVLFYYKIDGENIPKILRNCIKLAEDRLMMQFHIYIL